MAASMNEEWRGSRIDFHRRYARKLPTSRAGFAQQSSSRSIIKGSSPSISSWSLRKEPWLGTAGASSCVAESSRLIASSKERASEGAVLATGVENRARYAASSVMRRAGPAGTGAACSAASTAPALLIHWRRDSLATVVSKAREWNSLPATAGRRSMCRSDT